MFNFRISKYDPEKRDDSGAFTGNEWTSVFDGVSFEEFKKIEDKYIQYAISIIDSCDIQKLVAVEIEDNFNIGKYSGQLKKETKAYYDLFENKKDKTFTKDELKGIISLALREAAWFKLTGKNGFYLHFGYDLYMYVGSAKKEISNFADITGLYIEKEFLSPYA